MFRTPLDRPAKGRSRQYRVGVAGACSGCGASFIAGTAAFFLSEKGGCALAELGLPYFFHALDVPRRFPSGFLFYEDLLRDKKSLLSVRNMYGGLDLLLRRPDAEGLVSPMAVCRLPEDAAVFDLSGADDYRKRLYGFLSERLMNVWMAHNRLRVAYAPVVSTAYTLKDHLTYFRRDVTNDLRFRLSRGRGG